MEVPGGVVLQPGKYVIRLVESPSDRHIVEFLNDKQNHVYATVGAINNYRMTPTGKSIFTFYEMPAGQPEAIRAWFYPGDNFGQEFLYKKHFGQVVAQNTAQTTETQPAPQVAEAPAPPPPPPAAEPAPEPAPAPEVAQNEPAPAPAPAPAPEEPAPQTLPQTGSEIPLFALIGFTSLGAALGVRSFAKRTN
jgi:LPXTG-motif cell wall-anchored protein